MEYTPTADTENYNTTELAERFGGVLEEAVQHLEKKFEMQISAMRRELMTVKNEKQPQPQQPLFSLQGQTIIKAVSDEFIQKHQEVIDKLDQATSQMESLESCTKSLEVKVCKDMESVGRDIESVKVGSAPIGLVKELASSKEYLRSEFNSLIRVLRDEFQETLSAHTKSMEERFDKRMQELIDTVKSLPAPVVNVPNKLGDVRVVLEQRPVRRDLIHDDKTGRTIGMIESPVS